MTLRNDMHSDLEEPNEISALGFIAIVGAALMVLGVLFWTADQRTETALQDPAATTVGEGAIVGPPATPPTQRPDL
jgi:hypothetical protein